MNPLRFMLAMALALAIPGRAQIVSQGSIEGIVFDPSGAVIEGAAVRATNLGTSAVFTAITDSHGLFRFPALSPSSYEVVVEHAGFATFIQKNITLMVGAEVNLTIRLVVAGRMEKVEVSSVPPMMETARSSVSTTVDTRSVADLPVNGRNFLSLIALTPGVSTPQGIPFFSGQVWMNSLVVDGADHNAFAPSFVAGVDSDRYLFSQEAIAEFQVNRSAYSAEFGRGGMGVINVVTKSGTNDLHGALFWYYRDRGLNATGLINKLNNEPKDPLHVNQFGGAVGGPIVRDRLFFYGNFDAQRRSEPNLTFLNLPADFKFSPDPTIAGFQVSALSYLRQRADPYVATFDQNVFLAKLDWRLNPAQLLSGRWNRHRLFGKNFAAVGPEFSLEHSGSMEQIVDSVAVSLRSVISPSTVNVALWSYVSELDPFGRNSPNPEANVFEGGLQVLRVGGQPRAPADLGIKRLEGSDTLSLSRGKHALRLGANVLLDRGKYFTSLNFYGSYRFNSLASFGKSLSGIPSLEPGDRYVQAFSGIGRPPIDVRPNDVDAAGFVQDEWHLTPGLTLNGGLRYQVQVYSTPALFNPAMGLMNLGVDTSFVPTPMANLSPRLGLAWSPRQGGRVVVRAGFGLYYPKVFEATAARAYYQNGIITQTRTVRPDSPDTSWVPFYPNNACGPPDPLGSPPNCPAPVSAVDIVFAFSKTYQQPLVQHHHLSVEYQLAKNLKLEFSYSGVNSTHLQHWQDINLSIPTAATMGIGGTSTLLSYRSFPAVRPSANFDRVLLLSSNAYSAYHGLAIQMTKRFSANFQVLASYTWGKTVDDNPTAGPIAVPSSDGGLLSDSLDPGLDRGLGDFDQSHRFVASGIWELNYTRAWANPARKVLGGWELSGVFVAGSGFPYSGVLNFDLNNDGNASTDRLPGLGRNTFRSPSTSALDLRLTRSFQIARQAKLQARCDAFNLFNRANISEVRNTYYARSTSITDCGIAGTPCLVAQNDPLTGFGTPIATLDPRILQLSLRVVF